MTIQKAFSHGKAVIPFLTCGYPDLETSAELIYALETAGADLVILGIPFSDPAGEGSVLRLAGERALKNGVNTDHVFDFLGWVRQKADIPLALKTYANIVFAYGTERFLKIAAERKVSALILPDVPYEEQTEFKDVCDAYGIQFISFVVPAPEDRISQIASHAQGFIYLGGSLTEDLMLTLRQFTSLPVVTCSMANGAEIGANGIVLESEIMEIVDGHGKDAPQVVSDYARSVIASVKGHSVIAAIM